MQRRQRSANVRNQWSIDASNSKLKMFAELFFTNREGVWKQKINFNRLIFVCCTLCDRIREFLYYSAIAAVAHGSLILRRATGSGSGCDMHDTIKSKCKKIHYQTKDCIFCLLVVFFLFSLLCCKRSVYVESEHNACSTFDQRVGSKHGLSRTQFGK